MKLDTFVFVIVCVLAAVAASFWLFFVVLAALSVPYGALALIPAAIVGYVVWRVIAERLNNAEDDHYDKMEH